MLDGNDALLRRQVGQERRWHYIANRVNTFLRGLLILVDQNKPLFNFDLGAFEPEALGVRHSSNSNQQHLRLETDRLALGSLTRNTHARFGPFAFLEVRIDLR